MIVIGVTGTKGKSSTTEYVNAIFEAAGYKTAVLNSIREKIDKQNEANTMRMSMPGRWYIQGFLSQALRSGCKVAIIEMTSEGAKQHRQRGIALDLLIFTNLSPEHIESHGSYEAYENDKFRIGLQLARSSKRPRIIVANADNPHSARYLQLPVEESLPYSHSTDKTYHADEAGGHFSFQEQRIDVHLPGKFSLENALAAATAAYALGVSIKDIQSGIGQVTRVPGRAERIEEGQPFSVVVDYAHTPDSLTALFSAYEHSRKIVVMGATGGGRDKWKRPVMGKIAEEHCEQVILTNEDPYDEKPEEIVEQLASNMNNKPIKIIDRREAIRHGFKIACEWCAEKPTSGEKSSVAVLITGKGTDPTIAGPHGSKIPWSDAQVAREELAKLKGLY
ncbi:MAG: hypothetical protein RIQ56_741 [Candidatus Parcubacteria bacterium]